MFELAVLHHQAGRLAEAEAIYRDILGRDPDHLPTLVEYGRLALQLGRPEVAVVVLQRAAALAPDHPIVATNLGVAQEFGGHLDQAMVTQRRNIARHPGDGASFNNLGNVLRTLQRLPEAIRQYRHAIAVNPADGQLINNLGGALHQERRDAEAVAAFRASLARQEDAEVRHNLALALLSQGRLAEAWPEYEARSRTAQHAASWPQFPQATRWQGEDGTGRTLLIHAEQGMGDVLQFSRYVPLAVARGCRVVLQVHRPLLRLMRRLAGVADIVAQGEPLPACDLYCPLMSLPGVFGTTLEAIPAEIPYLSPYPEDVAGWAARLGPEHRPKVGLAWAGNPQQPTDKRRSVPVERLAPLLARTDFAFYSLQVDAAPPAGMIDLMGGVRDFADTAALIANLDLVIAVDSAVAHLAGAMGKPVWLLNRFDAEWRWLRDRDDSPWYPTLRQFRQTAPGDWDGVIARVRAELARMGAPSSSHWPNRLGCTI